MDQLQLEFMHNKFRWVKIGRSLLALGLCSVLLFGCKKEDTSKASALTIWAVSLVDTSIAGFLSTVAISSIGSYLMSKDANGKLAAEIPYLGPGNYLLTQTYYAGSLIIGKNYANIALQAGQNSVTPFDRENLDLNYDEDFDGWVNVAELIWRTDVNDPFSKPPSESPGFSFNSGGVSSQSVSYNLFDQIGDVSEGNVSSSPSYTLTSSF